MQDAAHAALRLGAHGQHVAIVADGEVRVGEPRERRSGSWSRRSSRCWISAVTLRLSRRACASSGRSRVAHLAGGLQRRLDPALERGLLAHRRGELREPRRLLAARLEEGCRLAQRGERSAQLEQRLAREDPALAGARERAPRPRRSRPAAASLPSARIASASAVSAWRSSTASRLGAKPAAASRPAAG